jgi:hypothetical protein
MKRTLPCLLMLGLIAALSFDALARFRSDDGPALAHMVFFTLKDKSPEAREAFLASCQKNLTGHEGTVYFSVGTIATDVEEPVSVKDFDVALHVVFASKQAKETYLKDPRHDAFVAENRAQFAQVRVYDSYLVPTP